MAAVQVQSLDPLMTVEEVSAFTRTPVQTLYRFRMERRGPVCVKIGRNLRYRRSDVEAWVQSLADERPPAA